MELIRKLISPPVQQTVRYQDKLMNDQVYDFTAVDAPPPLVEEVFFHGLPLNEKDADNTFWRTAPCISRRAEKKDGLGFNPRVLAFTYDSRAKLPSEVGTEGTDEYLLSENLVRNLILDPKGVGQGSNVLVILVGHDLRGILIMQFILFVEDRAESVPEGEEKNKFNNVSVEFGIGVFLLYSSQWVTCYRKFDERIRADNKNQMLTFMTVLGKEMSRVNERFTNYRIDPLKKRRFETFALNAAYLTTKGIFKKEMVCPEGTARRDIDHYYTVQADQVCQPVGKTSNCMTDLANNIVEVVEKIREKEGEEKERFERLKQFGKNISESSSQSGPGKETEITKIGETIP